MTDQEENRVSFVDVLAFVVRYRIALIITVVVAAAGAIILAVALPPNVIDAVYSTEPVVRLRSRYQSIPASINDFMSEPRFRLTRWDRYPEDVGELFINAGYETELDPLQLGEMLIDEGLFAISEDGRVVNINVTGVDPDIAVAALNALAEEAQRVAVRLLVSQAQDYIDRVYEQYGGRAGGPIPEGVPPEVQSRLLVLEPYAAGNYTNPIRANEPLVRERTNDNRRLAAAALFAAILSIVVVICLIDSYRRRVSADPKKMEKLRAAWRDGKASKPGT